MSRFRLLCLVLICLSFSVVQAQSKPFSLPKHNGAMLLDLDGFHVTQQSAKPDGREIGVRAHDSQHTELLAFLFLTPGVSAQNPATCLQQDMKQIRKTNGKFAEQLNPFNTGSPDSASILLTYPSGNQVLYKYAGAGDQCFFIQAYADKGSKLDPAQASAILARQHYDPNYIPKTEDALLYNAVEGAHTTASRSPSLPAKSPKMLVTWYGPGGIPLPTGPEWKLNLLTAYNNAAQPVAEFENKSTGVIASFIIVENKSGKPTAESCRNDAISAIQKGDSGPLFSNQTEDEMSDGHGGTFAIASHFTYIDASSHNHDIFAFAGDKKVCAEIHVSTVSGKPDEDKRLADALALFHPDLTYRPTSSDYFELATTFYKQSPMLGAPFYDASLKNIPTDAKDPDALTRRRIATDNIVIALGSSGNIERSRNYVKLAIKDDPDYPINYYNLARADAEENKVADAKLHLQQAFDRKANVISGENMPAPTTDSSFLKLKNNSDFWTFVQALK